MYKYFLILKIGICFSCVAAAQTPIFTIASATDHIIKSGTVVSMDGLVLTPTSDLSLSGKSLTRTKVATNPTSNPNINNYYLFNEATNLFTGAIQFNYVEADLNGLLEDALKLNVYSPKKSLLPDDDSDTDNEDAKISTDDNQHKLTGADAKVNKSNTSDWYLQSGGSNNTTDNYVQNTLNGVSLIELTLGNLPCVAPTAPTVTVTQPNCIGTTGTITISSNKTGLLFSMDGINYTNTSGVFTGLTPNNYNITAKNLGGCISNITNVKVNDIPTLAFTLQPANTSKEMGGRINFSVSAVGLVLGYQWQQLSAATGSKWVNINNSAMYSGATNSTLNVSGVSKTMTDYQFRCIVIGMCGTTIISNPATFTITKNNDSSAASNLVNTNYPNLEIATINVYPNPTLGLFNIIINNYTVGKAVIKITDVSGTAILVKEVTITNNNQLVPLQLYNVAKGTYFVQVLQPDHTQSILIVKE